MIFIISGTSRSGKTTAAKKLFEETHVPYIQTDAIMMAFHNGMPEVGVNHMTFSYEIAEKIWPFMKAFIEYKLEAKIDYIIEGEAFNAKDVRLLMDLYPGKIKAVYIGYTDITLEEKYQQIMKFSSKDDWLVNFEDQYIKEHLQNMISLSKRIKEEAIEYNIPYFDSSVNFNQTVQDVVQHFKNHYQSKKI